MNRMMLCGAVAASLLLAHGARAHDLHQSTGEAEFNPATNRLEVSLTFFANDLELALIRFSERMISLRDPATSKVDPLIQAYLKQVFVIQDHDGHSASLVWVGRDFEKATSPLDDERVTLYFEIVLPSGIAGQTLTHTALCSCFADQMNLLTLKRGDGKTELSFTKADTSKALGR